MDSQTPKFLIVAHNLTWSNSPNQLCCCLGGNHAGDEVFPCEESNHHCISVLGIGGHREKEALFSPLLSCFLDHKRKRSNASNIGRLLLYQRASLQPKAKLKYNTNEDEWLWVTLQCTVPRLLPTISFSLFSHFCTVKRSQGLALWRRWEFFLWPAQFTRFSSWPSAASLGTSCQLRVRPISESPCNSLAITCRQAGPGGTATSRGNTAPCQPRPRCPGSGAGRSRSGGSFVPTAAWARCPRRVCAPSPVMQGGCRVCAGARRRYPGPPVSAGKALWPRCSAWEPAVPPRWHGRHAPPEGCCTPRLRLHQMAASVLQLLIATPSSGITARCRQCGHPPLVLSVCSEETSFALFGAVFCFQNFSKICPWMLLFHFVFVVSYCIRNCSYNFFRASIM